jgi:hypothetical protein
MVSPAHEQEWFLITRSKWRVLAQNLVVLAFGLLLVWKLPGLLDPNLRLHGRGAWFGLLPPLVRALLAWALAAMLLLLSVHSFGRWRNPVVAALTWDGAVIYRASGDLRVAWSDVIEISVRRLYRPRIWMLAMKLWEPTVIDRLMFRRYQVAMVISSTNLKPKDVPAVLRRLRPDLLGLLRQRAPN